MQATKTATTSPPSARLTPTAAALALGLTVEAIRQECRIDPDTGCWEYVSRFGRPTTVEPRREVGGRFYVVARMVWELHRGLPLGRCFVRRKCDPESLCMNPRHLSAITASRRSEIGNVKGMTAARRAKLSRYAREHRARITLETARAIRAEAAAGDTYTVIALRHGTSRSNVGKIVQGKVWRDDGPLPQGVGAHSRSVRRATMQAGAM